MNYSYLFYFGFQHILEKLYTFQFIFIVTLKVIFKNFKKTLISSKIYAAQSIKF